MGTILYQLSVVTIHTMRKLEPFLHTIPLLWGLGTATIGIPLRLYNNANLWCWIASYPAGCVRESCIRGAYADWYRWSLYYGPLWLNIIGITTAMVLVFRHVRKASQGLSHESEESAAALLTDKDGEKISGDTKDSTRSVRRDVAIQCFLYSGCFYLNWIWLTVSYLARSLYA